MFSKRTKFSLKWVNFINGSVVPKSDQKYFPPNSQNQAQHNIFDFFLNSLIKTSIICTSTCVSVMGKNGSRTQFLLKQNFQFLLLLLLCYILDCSNRDEASFFFHLLSANTLKLCVLRTFNLYEYFATGIPIRGSQPLLCTFTTTALYRSALLKGTVNLS